MSDELFSNICLSCGKVDDNLPKIENLGKLCNDCLDKYFFQCPDCEEYFEISDDIFDLNGIGYVCPNCKNNYVQCRDCDEYFLQDDMLENDEDFYCEDCQEDYFTCSDCSDFIHMDNSNSVGDNIVCNTCYEDHYHTCQLCEDPHHEDNIPFNNDLDCYVCESCYEEYVGYCEHCDTSYWINDGPQCDCSNSNLHNNCYSPSLNFSSIENGEAISRYSNSPDNLYLGFELEVIFKADKGLGEFLEYHLDNDEEERQYYCKEDGSLPGDTGCEIVSQPMTLEYHLKEAKWSPIIDKIQSIGATSHDNGACGLHIHINRSFLYDWEPIKLLHFSDLFQRKLEELGRREFGHYCNSFRTSIYFDGNDFPSKSEYEKYTHDCPTRYSAVNTKSRDTIEFRFPKGTLNKDTFYATLQLIDSIVRYCKSISFETLTSSSWEDFKDYVYNLNSQEVTRNRQELITYGIKKGVF